jgi:hypothetical protein
MDRESFRFVLTLTNNQFAKDYIILRHALRLQNILELFNCLLDQVITRLVDHSVVYCRRHIGYLLTAFGICIHRTRCDRRVTI